MRSWSGAKRAGDREQEETRDGGWAQAALGLTASRGLDLILSAIRSHREILNGIEI